MIYSDDCWMKDVCKKYNKKDSDANCKTQNCYCIKLFKMDKLYELALIPKNLRKHENLILDSDKRDQDSFEKLKAYENYIEQFVDEGRSIFIYSSICGNGKTAWSLRLAQEYLTKIWHKCDLECKVLFVSVPRYLQAVKDSFSETNEYASYIKDNIFKADLVIFDDIATKPSTQFEMDHLFTIIDNRMNLCKSNIFTSNLTPELLNDCLGPRIASRIVNYSDLIQFTGTDKRFLRFMNI